MPSVGERVNNLERVLAEYIRNVGNAQMQTEKELREFKEEMQRDRVNSRNEMQVFKEAVQMDGKNARNEMQAFKEAMQIDGENSKNEARKFKEEMLEDRKKMFKQWGEIANKMGTLAEDIVAPSVREIAQRYFGCEKDGEEDFMVRRFKRKAKDKGKRREFDVIAVYDNKVILVEVKSTPRMPYIDDFVATLKELHEYFPEYKGKKIIPVFASLYLPDEVIAYLTKNGILAMATRDDMMDLMNFGEMNQTYYRPV